MQYTPVLDSILYYGSAGPKGSTKIIKDLENISARESMKQWEMNVDNFNSLTVF